MHLVLHLSPQAIAGLFYSKVISRFFFRHRSASGPPSDLHLGEQA
jgi:hypothetical protein